MGWAFDEPTMVFGDVTDLPVRLSAVFHRRDGRFKIVHLHFSVGVPDERLAQLGAP